MYRSEIFALSRRDQLKNLNLSFHNYYNIDLKVVFISNNHPEKFQTVFTLVPAFSDIVASERQQMKQRFFLK